MATSKVFTTSVLEGHSGHGFGFGLLPASGTVNLPTHIARGWKSTMEKKGTRPPNLSMTGNGISGRTPSVAELRMSLLVALASQAASQSQRFLQDLASETLKYVNPRRFDARNLEEASMAVPDLETIPYRVLRREKDYEIRQVESYYVAETTMPGKTGFDFYGSSQGFNVLAAYLFGKNTKREEMAMTTPVFVQKTQPDGEKMEMTTPVITKQAQDQEKWQMSFVMPSKYGADLPLPNDPSVRLKRVQEKIVAVAAFSGFVTDEEVRHRESKLRAAISKDPQVRVKENASIEVAQYNPPFTPPFMRRNEVSLEVEWAQDNIE